MARIEASASQADDMLRRGIDIRYVVTSLPGSDAEHIYGNDLLRPVGRPRTSSKQHKAQLASDRTKQFPAYLNRWDSQQLGMRESLRIDSPFMGAGMPKAYSA